MKNFLLLKPSRIHHTKHMRVHLQSFLDYWSRMRRGRFKGMRVIAPAFDKGVAPSLDLRIQEATAREYVRGKKLVNYEALNKDLFIPVRCKVYILMTGQEKGVKQDLGNEQDKFKLGYLIVSSLRNHVCDVIKALRPYLRNTTYKDSGDDPKHVLAKFVNRKL